MSPSLEQRTKQLLAAIASEFGHILRSLQRLETSFAEVVGHAGISSTTDLAALRPKILEVLEAHRDIITGAGAVLAPGVLANADLWLEWWWGSPGNAAPLRVNLDPASVDYFDYTTAEWYVTTAETAAPRVSGPYVDYACTNEYVLTVAVPSITSAGLAGIVAGDVPVSNLERRVLPRLRELGRPMVLTNPKGRVVTSTSPLYMPGVLIPKSGSAPVTLSDASWRRCGVDPVAMGWLLWDPAALGLRHA